MGNKTFGQKVMAFNAGLRFDSPLPPGFEVMNPFRENDCAIPASTAFYEKYYNDHMSRGIILGINPGRFGAGITGVPFTDPKRLSQCCHIDIPACKSAHEPSSRFIYEMIALYGGVDIFYRDWYINSICPLGFLKTGKTSVNANYYDKPELKLCAEPFILRTLRQQLAFGIRADLCFCMGKGKNMAFLSQLNRKHKFFGEIVPLEHPRFIIQYRSDQLEAYARKYVDLLRPHARNA